MINVGIFCMLVEDILLVEVNLIKSVDLDKHAPNKKKKILVRMTLDLEMIKEKEMERKSKKRSYQYILTLI